MARHIPKRSFQPAGFAASASRQSLPSLSSLLSRSFNSQLNPSNAESPENNDASSLSVSNFSNVEKVDGEDIEYIALDVLQWRWPGEQQSSMVSSERLLIFSHIFWLLLGVYNFSESDLIHLSSSFCLLLKTNQHVLLCSDRVNSQDMGTHSFLEVGAAAVLVGDMEAKMKGRPWSHFRTAEMPHVDQLLQPSSVTTATNSASARPHLKAITSSKRSRSGTYQIWYGFHSQS